MSKKILNLAISRLWNSEYTIFVNHLISIIARFQPTVLHLEKVFNKLQSFIPALSKIEAQELGNAISKILSKLDSERDILYKAIVAQLKTLSNVNLPDFTPHVAVLNKFVNKHGEDIPDDSYHAETKRLKDMERNYNSDENVRTAAEALNLKVIFEKIFGLNTTFDEQFLQRNIEEAAVEKVNSRTIRREIDVAIKDFYTAVDFCSREYDELDYETLTNELNNLITYYKSHLKSRETRRKNGEDVSIEEPIVGPEK